MTGQRSTLVSAFDDMLRDARTRFDALDGRGDGNRAASPQTGSPARPATAADTARAVLPGEQRVRDRFGDRWRHEVLERRREGDEVIVLCKLSVEDEGARSQFGRATIGAASSRKTASTGGTAFSIGAMPDSPVESEDEAYRQAVDDALGQCLRLF